MQFLSTSNTWQMQISLYNLHELSSDHRIRQEVFFLSYQLHKPAPFWRYFQIFFLLYQHTIIIGRKRAFVFGPKSGLVHISTPDGQLLASKAFTLTIPGSTTKLLYSGIMVCSLFSLYRDYFLSLPSHYYEQHNKSTEGQWTYQVKKTGAIFHKSNNSSLYIL